MMCALRITTEGAKHGERTTGEPNPEELEAGQRSLSAALIQAGEVLGSGVLAGVSGAATNHLLQGDDKPAEEPPEVIIPTGVHPEDD
jgi:hypothetical protein